MGENACKYKLLNIRYNIMAVAPIPQLQILKSGKSALSK